MTREEAFKQYEEALDKLDKEYHEAREKIRAATIRDLKAIRALKQKTRRIKCQAS